MNIRHVFLIAVVALGSLSCLPRLALGHEIPNDVTVHIIVKPEANRLRVLVRAPLEAMQDMDFPTTGAGFLDVAAADAVLRDSALRWLANDILLYADSKPLAPLALNQVRASIPSDRSFTRFDSAQAHIESDPIREGTQLVWRQALLDASFEIPIESENASFSILPDLDRLGLQVAVAIRFEAANGTTQVYQLDREPELIELDPRWHQAALRFIGQGFRHILDGLDHLLFLLCLVLPFRKDFRSLVWIVTAFTVAHSITLTGSAFGIAPSALWFPPLVETLIAASILYMAIENVAFARVRTRWVLAFVFGLVHGFGFAFALENTLQFAGDHLLMSLLSFNLGVELGQLLVLLLLIPLLNVTFKYIVPERIGIIVISVIVGHSAWHWLAERYAALSLYSIV
jgi:hypothetical protein